MSHRTIFIAFACLLPALFSIQTYGQNFGANATAVSISDCNQSSFYNTSGSGVYEIAPVANVFTNTNFGVHTHNSGTLILRGAEIRTFKTPGVANICNVRMYYRTYLETATPGAFNIIEVPFLDDCDVPNGSYTSGGACIEGDKKWKINILDGVTTPYAPIDLTTKIAGNYVLEVYFELTGSSTTTSGCEETILEDNSGDNYKAFYSIQSPILSSNNPSTCNGTEGSITISGLVSGATYSISYIDDDMTVGPADYVANASGQVVLSGLNAGIYTSFSILINGCSTDLNTGLILSNPVLTPTFNKIPSFCAGSTAPSLPSTSNNGVTGTWAPAVIDNQTSATYKFTPDAGQCGIPVNMNVVVKPILEPTFSFGSSLTICGDASVPILPTTSTNGKIGSWNPSVVDNQNSGTYTFTPATGQCATQTTFTVTVTPNITPTFSFGTALTICADDDAIPNLPTTSTNGITGSWNPSVVSNQVSDVYTFTPTPGLCATTTTFTVTVNPNEIPTFDFGTSLSICSGETVPVLPTTSENSITGTWIPAEISNTASDTYTFLPNSGLCATQATFTVTVAPNIPPVFDFGTTLTICDDGSVPVLPTTSENGITGIWNPSLVDNQNSDTYTFTPTAGQCATTTTFSVTVNPNITPTFSFGTSLTICEDATAPGLPTTSTNGITGTWSPSTIDNTTSDTYTFTPTAGLCATTATLTVTITPNEIPTFSFGTSLNICAGESVPVLPASSVNGINGSWNPSIVDDQQSAVYTFTPDAGLCAIPATFTVTVAPNIPPTFDFGTTLTICDDGSVPVLPGTSENGITGTWDPSLVDNQNSDTYTFTPTAGQCATTTTFSVTVNPNITPTFSFGTSLTICEDATAPTLPTTSTNNITGTWSPAIVDNQASGNYTFTPTAGQCAIPTIFTVTVNPNELPTFDFGSSLTICAGETVPALPASSDNGITGTWNPSIVDNQNSGTYTFTPGGGCASSITFTVTVTPNIIPTFDFGTSLTICADGTVPALTNTSVNGITGTWTPAIVSNSASDIYTFTPNAGVCATTATFTVTVNPNITPTFNFGTSLTICGDATAPTLPTTSTNGITGTWSPSIIDNVNNGTYSFMPTTGLCATTTTLTVTITPNVRPTFSFGTALTICAGATVPTLPSTSANSIAGTWSPSLINDQQSADYTFTPATGSCAIPVTLIVIVNPNITPTFDFGTTLTICAEDFVPELPLTSENGITGTWNPAVVNKQTSGVYTFTPTTGLCATTATFNVTVNQNVLPTFEFGTALTICSDSTVPELPTVSTNGITGTWNPSTVDNHADGIYTFTPAAGSCGTMTTFSVTVTPSIAPTFDLEPTLTICTGGDVPELLTTSINGIEGIWEPAIVDNEASGVYIFTPDATPEQCIGQYTLTVTVNPILEPTFSFGKTLSLCLGSTAPLLPTTSENGITGTWTPAQISNQASATYTFTSTPGQCATEGTTLAVTIHSIPTVNAGTNNTVNDGNTVAGNSFTGTPADVSFNWTNSNPAIGLAANGTGNVASFTATNQGSAPISGTITVTPMNNGCPGTSQSYVITVNPLDKDVFVPNVFTPNNDGKNDILYVYSNYITQLEMRIFNQYGQEIYMTNDVTRGWDGTHRGKQQPVGVYVYTLRAVLTDGRTIKSKGSITLLR